MAQAAAGSGAGRSAGGGGHGPRRAHTLALRLARTPAHTHTRTHTRSPAPGARPPARPPAGRWPLGLRAERGLSRHRGSGEGGGGRGGGGRGCRRCWRSRPPLRAPLEEPGPGRESEPESGPQPESEPRPGLPVPPPLSWREPSPGFKSAGSRESRAGSGRSCWRGSGRSGVWGPGPGPDAASHSGRQRWRAGGSRRGRSHTLLFLLCGWRRVLSAFFFREVTEGGEKYEIIHASDEFTAK
ncbi:uncharacterized protein LOC110329255 [Mus pahari]|uniref:uncharacterized protein LOC110329255 n=1 Tax=Mus pahari TaxID=10093 RepID=UPI000A30524F|nr:uncharacterized protein LOC110329255 [Mus pahari]